jgi:hypothetical protein
MTKTKYERVKQWRAKFPEKVAAQHRRRVERHRQKIYEQQRVWRRKNAERLKPKDARKAAAWRMANPEAQRQRIARWKERRLAKMVAIAERPKPDRCEICGSDQFKIVFDHCHQYGQFRGWICDRCNKVLGLLKDDVQLLMAMVAYLEVNQNGEVDEQKKKQIAQLGFR